MAFLLRKIEHFICLVLKLCKLWVSKDKNSLYNFCTKSNVIYIAM